MMSSLDTLLDIENKIKQADNFEVNERIILIDLIRNKANQIASSEDAFIYFYTDVSGLQDIFNFSSVLEENYKLAQDHADVCISVFSDFSALEEGPKLGAWLQSAIRVVDCIVIHYLQEVLNMKPALQGEAKKERSRYIQINKKGIKAQKAGRIMDNLYGVRNKVEHITRTDPDDPNKHKLYPPKYGKILRKINTTFPEALLIFDSVYRERHS